MKKTLLIIFNCAVSIGIAQNTATRHQINEGAVATTIHNLVAENNSIITKTKPLSENKSLVACLDKVMYTGTATGADWQLGGFNGWTGSYEVFPSFTGQVSAISFVGKKMGTANPVVAANIYAMGGGPPWTTPIGTVNITVNNAALTEFTGTFGSAVSVSGGFVVGLIYASASDSVVTEGSPNGVGMGNDYSYVDYQGTFLSLLNDFTGFGGPFDEFFLVRPTIKFNSVINTLNISPSSTCTATPVNFTGVLGAVTSNYYSPIYNPSGVTESIDFGDATTPYSGSVTSHSYASSGTYTASYNATYVGWTTNCVSVPAPSTISVNPACTPLFSWSSVNLAVTFNNLSTGATSSSWLFGDGGTSGSMTTVVHNYAASGTYTVELTANGPCGTNLYQATISITDSTSGGNIGIAEISNAQSVRIYPNPSTNVVNVQYDIINTNELATIEITDVAGKTIESQMIGSSTNGIATFDISQLANATYYVSMMMNGKRVTKPFVKQSK